MALQGRSLFILECRVSLNAKKGRHSSRQMAAGSSAINDNQVGKSGR